MSQYSKLIRYLIPCLFCLSIIFPITAHPQQNTESNDPKYLYDQGKKAFEGLTGFGGAKGQLDFANKRLNEILTLEDIQNIFGPGELQLSDFFLKLREAHIRLHPDDTEQFGDLIDTIEGTYSLAAEGLKEATEYFEKAVKLDSNYTDAHLKLADVYLTMNNEQKAVEAYQKAAKPRKSVRTLGFKGMTLSLRDLRDITRRIAKVYSKDEIFKSVSSEESPSEGKEGPGVEIIKAYMSFAESYLKDNQDETKALGFDSSEAALIVNKFELAQFYIDTSRPTNAREEYEDIYSKVEADLQKEEDAKKRVQELNSQIEEMEGNVASVTFSFDTKWEASSLESMEALLNLIPDTTIVGEGLAKYYVVSILPTGMSIKLADEMVINNERKEVSRIIPTGKYKGIVTLSQPNIKNKKDFPFRIILSSQTLDLDLKMREIESNDDKVTMYIHNFTLPSGLNYNFRIEPPPPPPSFLRKAALIVFLACAAVTAAIAY